MRHLLDLFRSAPNRGPAPRLSSEEAIRIAVEAAPRSCNTELLTQVGTETRSGQLVWLVSEATMGSTLVIEIDDATGEVLTTRRIGVR